MSKPTPSPQDNRNLLIAVLICALVFLGFDYFRLQANQDQKRIQEAQMAVNTPEQVAEVEGLVSPGAPQMLGQSKTAKPSALRADANALIDIRSATMEGRVALKGGRIDKLLLPQYAEDLKDQEPVQIFNPSGDKVFFYEAGWLAENLQTPNGNTNWQANQAELLPGKPLTINWQSPNGLLFKRQYTLNPNDYTITVVDEVSNNTGKPVSLVHYTQLHKGMVPAMTKEAISESSFTRFVGPEGVLAGEHETVAYKELAKKGAQTFTSRDGWAGVSTPYFLGAIIPQQDTTDKTTTYRYSSIRGKDFFSVDIQNQPVVVQPSGYAAYTYNIFAGPKRIELLERQGAQLTRAVDFGWYHVIAKFFFDLVMMFHGWVGNLGLAVILVTVLIKLVLWPLSAKSYVAMSRMKVLQPKMMQLKEKHGDDRQAMSMEMMSLYRKHKVNPMSGCWPVMLQIPVFFAFYKMILISFEFRHEPFFGWIQDLSTKDPYFILPILMGLTMVIQQKLNPAPTDPVQAKVMKFLPAVFTIVFAVFPAGLVLYWTTNSILSVAQQYFIMRRLGTKSA